MRLILTIFGLLGALSVAPATTIERLSMDEMIAKSTQIVRGKAVATQSARHGGMIFTEYTFQVAESLKGGGTGTLRLSVPGGTLGAARQSFAGTPKLEMGQEYVVFVWTSRGGVHHVIGLSQGLFKAELNTAGNLVLRRGPAAAHVVDKQGEEIEDTALELTWGELTRRVRGPGVAR